MSNPALTTLRSTIATALTNDGVWQVFSFPPASPIANSVIISPDDPYIEPNNNSNALDATANFRITVVVPLLDNQANLGDLEYMILQMFTKLSASGLSFKVSAVSAPTTAAPDMGQMLMYIGIAGTAISWWMR